MNVCVISKVKIKPGCVDEATRQWLIAATNMKKGEPDLLKWDILQSSHDPLVFYCVEEFADQAAIEFHLQQDYVKASVEAFKDLIDGDAAATPEELRTFSDVTKTIVCMNELQVS